MVFRVWNANQPTAAALRVAEVRRQWAEQTRWAAVKTRLAALVQPNNNNNNGKLLRQSPYEKAADSVAVQQPRVEEKDSFLRVCTIDKMIGEGGYGRVYRVQYLGQTACLKTALDKEAKESLGREIRFLRELDGIGGAPMVLCTPDGDHHHDAPAWFIMEYLEGDLLEDVIYRHPYAGPSPYLRIFVDLAFQLQLVHVMDVVHNDLKFNNIIITPDPDGQNFHAHIFDFGLGTRVGEPCQCFGQHFNPRYHYPPELFGHTSPSTPATDVYQLGLMMSRAVSLLSECGSVGQWPQPDYLAQYIDRMLDPKPARRPNMRQVVVFLQALVCVCDH